MSGPWYDGAFGILHVLGDGLLVFKAAVSRRDEYRFQVVNAAPQLSFNEGDITDLGALEERLSETML